VENAIDVRHLVLPSFLVETNHEVHGRDAPDPSRVLADAQRSDWRIDGPFFLNNG
jgi:hypothetical protein